MENNTVLFAAAVGAYIGFATYIPIDPVNGKFATLAYRCLIRSGLVIRYSIKGALFVYTFPVCIPILLAEVFHPIDRNVY